MVHKENLRLPIATSNQRTFWWKATANVPSPTLAWLLSLTRRSSSSICRVSDVNCGEIERRFRSHVFRLNIQTNNCTNWLCRRHFWEVPRRYQTLHAARAAVEQFPRWGFHEFPPRWYIFAISRALGDRFAHAALWWAHPRRLQATLRRRRFSWTNATGNGTHRLPAKDETCFSVDRWWEELFFRNL